MQLPPDKAIFQRALLLATIAKSPSVIYAKPHNDDVWAVVDICRQLGAEISELENGLAIHPISKWPQKIINLDCGESGTAFRMLIGLLAGLPIECNLIARGTLRHRPMDRVIEPIRSMGGQIDLVRQESQLILKIKGTQLRGIQHVNLPASAQVKSAVLMAGLHASGRTTVAEPIPTRDHTEKLLIHMGTDLHYNNENQHIALESSRLEGREIRIPGDPSVAAYFLAANLLAQKYNVVLKEVCVNSYRIGFIRALERMGAVVQQTEVKSWHGEPVADLSLASSADLHGITIANPEIPTLIDEIPLLAVIATVAKGETQFLDCGELRYKESDRLHAICELFSQVGVPVGSNENSLSIQGPVSILQGDIDAHGDHRIAMAAALLSLISQEPIHIHQAQAVNKSDPEFFNRLHAFYPVTSKMLSY